MPVMRFGKRRLRVFRQVLYFRTLKLTSQSKKWTGKRKGIMMNMQEAFPSVAALAPGKAIASASAEAAAVAMAGRRCARPAAPAASAAGGAFAASAPVAFASGSSLVVRSGDAASAAGEPYFRARGLGLKTYAGYVYRDVDVDARAEVG